jgi:hypothetical protein
MAEGVGVASVPENFSREKSMNKNSNKKFFKQKNWKSAVLGIP